MDKINTLQIIKTIPKLDRKHCIEWTRPLNDILQIAWLFLSKIIYGLERPEPIFSGSKGEENTRDLNDNNSNPSYVSGMIRAA